MEDTYTRENIKKFYNAVEMPGGYQFNHVETLRRINLYYSSRFESGDTDSTGKKKYFHNIVRSACDVARKFIDIDTKDVLLTNELANQEWKIWLMVHDLKTWLKVNAFGVTLNQVVDGLPKYGHIVLKKDKTRKWNPVPLENIRTDPATDELENAEFVYFLNRMTPAQLREMKSGWKHKDKVVKLLEAKQPYYEVYECYDRNVEDSGKKWVRTFKANLYTKQTAQNQNAAVEAAINDQDEYLPAIVLHEDKTDKLDVREHKFEDTPGRWLGLGFTEMLFENQERKNENVNLRSKNLRLSSLLLFYTRDETIGKNVLTDVENGDIVRTSDALNPVQNQERNLEAFQYEDASLDGNTQALTFSQDITKGENLPADTPLGVANIQVSMIMSYFDRKREDLGLFIKSLLLEDIIPSFKTGAKARHNLTLLSTAEGAEKFVRWYAKLRVDKAAFNHALKTGFFPDGNQRAAMEQEFMRNLAERRNLVMNVPDEYYDDAKFTLDINITGEQLNVGVATKDLMTIIQLIFTNPAVLTNPGARAMVMKLIELRGFSPVDLNLIEEGLKEPMPAAQGANIGSPQSSALPQVGIGSPAVAQTL